MVGDKVLDIASVVLIGGYTKFFPPWGTWKIFVLHSDFNELLPTMNDPNWMSRNLIMPYVF
jgi:hypothetical protein